jgi:hypothetical protein
MQLPKLCMPFPPGLEKQKQIDNILPFNACITFTTVKPGPQNRDLSSLMYNSDIHIFCMILRWQHQGFILKMSPGCLWPLIQLLASPCYETFLLIKNNKLDTWLHTKGAEGKKHLLTIIRPHTSYSQSSFEHVFTVMRPTKERIF